ncbi:UDP-N-acetylmuramate dehydrogenase [Sporofaciens sp. SGI.106]|uniref:UDP-N-acetylmuramate dehydrogenase n=1 Tax=Sporofaciens sp. SGI.106 TaxID=3420568 RepID=UPI002A97593C|nr:UDP-N-acetylmuramate dehydrogenase [Lachnoclostridium sp.]
MKQNLYEKLAAVLGQEKVLAEEPMKKHTTFRVGGPADLFVMPSSEEEVKAAAAICDEEKVPYYIVGNGSNLLVSDKGYRGVIIQLYKEMSRIRVEDNVIYAQAGASLAKIANTALESSLTGFEFAAGIPGTIGGACVMNAGAYGGEMKDVLLEVRVMTSDGEVIVLPKEKLELGYRTSVIAKEGYIVLEAAIELRPGEQETIRTYMEELREKRTSKQPLEYPSAGSTFKRPEGYFAGKLIQDAGLRGFQVGGAQVSEKHCGFVINAHEATAADIVSLMDQVSGRVREQFGVVLEPEVKKLGEF